MKLLCIFGMGCGVFGELMAWLVYVRDFDMISLPLFEVDGAAIIELIIWVEGVVVGEKSSSSCFFADKNGS